MWLLFNRELIKEAPRTTTLASDNRVAADQGCTSLALTRTNGTGQGSQRSEYSIKVIRITYILW